MAKEVNKEKKVKNEKEKKGSFFKDFKAELKKVTWPTSKQLINNTIAVIAIVIVFSVVIFVLDVIFESMNKFGVEKLKNLVTSSSSENAETDEATETDENEENTDASEVDSTNNVEVEVVEGDTTVETTPEATEQGNTDAGTEATNATIPENTVENN